MRRTRREVLKLAGAGALGAPLLPDFWTRSQATGSKSFSRPNLLFVMTDQQRWDTLSCAGNSVIKTPNIDRLARSGAMFNQMSCLSPVCGPSRAALLTGKIFKGHGCNGSVHQFSERKRGMKAKVRTYDETLAAAGYRMEYFGKWHTGAGHHEVYESGLKTHYLNDYEAEMRGKYGTPGTYKQRSMVCDTYTGLFFHPYPVNAMMSSVDQRHRGDEDEPKIHHDPETGWSDIPHEDSLTAWLVKRTIGFLEQEHDRPFALTCSILHPHSPLVTNGKYTKLLDPAEMPLPENVYDDESHGQFGVPAIIPLRASGIGRFIAQYLSLVVEIDYWVGELMSALDRLGLRENTLVVFTSDHGELMGSHGQVGKSRVFEEAIRVPMLLSFPGRVRAGVKVDVPVSGVDVAPTLLDYLGVPFGRENRFDGESLRAAIEGEAMGRDFAPLELNRKGMRVRGMRKAGWKLGISERYGQRLHDLEQDPLELQNLIAPKAEDRSKYLEVARKLRAELTEYMGDHGDVKIKDLPELR